MSALETTLQRALWAGFALAAFLFACGPMAWADGVSGPPSGEGLAGVETRYDSIVTPEGYHLRVIVTRPQGVRRPAPTVYFVQWLSCDTVELGAAQDGWSQLLRGLAERSGFVLVRLEKEGVGASQGRNCQNELDYETELRDHRQALAWALRHSWIDPSRVVVFGASMGATYAPLLAEGQDVTGVAVWGGGARSWFERQLSFERSALELSGASAEAIDAGMRDAALFYSRFLLERRDLNALLAEPGMREVWARLHGVEGNSLFGRPGSFHQQAQAQSWAQAWSRVDAPVLVMLGEYDWYEEAESARLIRNVVQAQGRAATFELIRGLDHHFMRYPSRQQAFGDENGVEAADAVLHVLIPWLHAQLQ